MKKIKKEINMHLKNYNITKKDKHFILQELLSIYEEDMDIDKKIKLIMTENEIFEIESIRLSIILLSFLLITYGVSLFFTPISFTILMALLLLIYGIDLAERKKYALSILSLLLSLTFVNAEYEIFSFQQVWTFALAFIFVFLGFKLLFKQPSKKPHSKNVNTVNAIFSNKKIQLKNHKEKHIKINAKLSTIIIDTTGYNYNEEILMLDIDNVLSDIIIIADNSTYIRSNIVNFESISAQVHPANKIIISGKNTLGKIKVQY